MRRTLPLGLVMASLWFLADGIVLAQYEVGIGVPNWTVPAYRAQSGSASLSTMTDISPGVAFVAMSPCRVFDTRGANGPYGGPRLVGNTTRNFDIDNGPCTGIPTGVDAYSMNFGAILPDGLNSFITIWPTGSAQPLVSSINPIQGGVVANAAIVPAGTNGSISVFPNTGLHLYGDINGYFTDQLNPGVPFDVVSSSPWAVRGTNTSSAFQAIGVLGQALAATGNTVGVWGETFSSTDGARGVMGYARGATGSTYGVQGLTLSGSAGSAGVFGVDASGVTASANTFSRAGVRGESNSLIGVLGVTGPNGYAGVQGTVAGGPYGVLGLQGSSYGVFAFGDLGGTGAKYFVEPHPSDASKVIRYVSLEGPESGTYFRGRGKFQNGLAKIEVPEDFRLVTDPENLSVVVTPIGEMASFAVVKVGLNEIVVKSSRNVEFFYIVNGVRKTHKHLTPIENNGREYMPETPDAKMPLHLTEGQKEMLISNGTYKPDGTVNMETARRLGWDKEWEKRSRPVPQPSSE